MLQASVRWPGPAARGGGKDLRTTVTFRDDSLPLPVRVHFVHSKDDDGAHEFRNVGFEVGEELRDEERALVAPELTAVTLRRVVERYPHWLELARVYAAVELDAPKVEIANRLRRVKPARLDADWYRMIGAEFRHHTEAGEPAPVTSIAESHGVTVSAASRWVKRARELERKEAGHAS